MAIATAVRPKPYERLGRNTYDGASVTIKNRAPIVKKTPKQSLRRQSGSKHDRSPAQLEKNLRGQFGSF
jgi:hypothetical protein